MSTPSDPLSQQEEHFGIHPEDHLAQGEEGAHESHELSTSGHTEDEGHAEPWLISYADLMTLLVGFFVILFAFASENTLKETPGMILVRKELAKYFGLPSKSATEPTQENQPTADTAVAEELKKRAVTLIEELKREKIVESADIIPKPYGFDLNFKSAVLFDSGSAKIYTPIEEELRALGLRLNQEPFKPRVVVEGHTDDVPVKKSSLYPSNWELSSARAGAVVRILQEAGYPETRLAAVGLAASMPLAPNQDEDGNPLPDHRTLNRRVTLRVFFNPDNESRLDGASEYGPPAPPSETDANST